MLNTFPGFSGGAVNAMNQLSSATNRLVPPTHRRRSACLLGLFLLAIVLAIRVGGHRGTMTAGGPASPADSKTASIAERWGIEVSSLRRTAAGYMLDFRYRVVDAEKAAPLFRRKTNPYLIDQETGAKFIVPNLGKVGPLRNSNTPKPGRGYFMFFANPGGFVQAGNMVTVVIGDFRLEDLIVQ